MFDKIQKGKQNRPPRVIVYGTEGIGKSTFAACAPSPLFIQTEDGLGQIDCDKFPIAESFDDVMSQLREVYSVKHEYKTLAIDSLDWLEKLVWGKVAENNNCKSIEQIGYGKGYKFASDLWREILEALNYIRDVRGMAIILIAHSKIERFNNPETEAYDRYTLALHKDADAMIREWSDAVLFATQKMRVQTEDTGFNKTRTIAKGIGKDGGERILRTIGSPACVAKNRYDLPGEIPLIWDEFAKHLNA